MPIEVPYERKAAPTVGFLMVTLEQEFDKTLKEKVKGRYRQLFDELLRRGAIGERSLFFPSCCSEKDVLAACEQMLDARVDGIVYHPLTWPAGETVSALAAYRYLKDVPLFVSASPEIAPEGARPPYAWPQNSDCGKIFARSMLYKLDRPSLWATGAPEEEAYRRALADFLAACQLVRRARAARVAVIGNILDDFPESFYNPMTVRRETGVRVLEVDSAVLFTLFESGEYPARGLKIDPGRAARQTAALKDALQVKVRPEALDKPARAYLAYKAIIESVGAEAAVFRCAPEWVEKHQMVVCGVLAELIDNGVIASGGCEGDVLNTVGGLLQHYASGRPTTCMDWIDRPGAEGEGMYTLLHCGNACKGMVQPGKGVADYHQAWTAQPLGYTIEGPLTRGAVTVCRLRENRGGELELLIAEGESAAQEMRIRGNYGLVRFGRERLARLVGELNENGWPHHLSLGWGHHGDVLEKAARFLGRIRVVRI